ncbi:MAG: hypothetical protein EAY75_10850 [Bacteroidetes bacterium]|nr:MAG: hypothetical protein EAY75_10850 [Bacteroidota bacterium]
MGHTNLLTLAANAVLPNHDAAQQATEWQQLGDTFPWYATPWIMMAKNQKDSAHTEKAALFVPNTLWLHWLLTEYDTSDEAAVLATEPAVSTSLTPNEAIKSEATVQATAMLAEETILETQQHQDFSAKQEFITQNQLPFDASTAEASLPTAVDVSEALATARESSAAVFEETLAVIEHVPAEAHTPAAIDIAEALATAQEPSPAASNEALAETLTAPPEDTMPTVVAMAEALATARESSAAVFEEAFAEIKTEPAEPTLPTAEDMAKALTKAPEPMPTLGEDVISDRQILPDNQPLVPHTEAVREKPTGLLQVSYAAAATENTLFTPYHLVDYFASQGIKLSLAELPNTSFDKKVMSFTQWLKTMKKVNFETQAVQAKNDPAVEASAKASLHKEDVVTEAMALVLEQQGKDAQAIQLYLKLLLLHPEKSAFFAGRISELNKK